jgi:hypothetical protein
VNAVPACQLFKMTLLLLAQQLSRIYVCIIICSVSVVILFFRGLSAKAGKYFSSLNTLFLTENQ